MFPGCLSEEPEPRKITRKMPAHPRRMRTIAKNPRARRAVATTNIATIAKKMDARDATDSRGKDAVDESAASPPMFVASRPLVAVGRLSDAADIRARARDADETAVKPDEAPGFGLSAGPPMSVSGPPSEYQGTSRGGGVRLAILSVLAVLAILLGAVWAAISLGIIRVEFMPARSQAKLPEQAPYRRSRPQPPLRLRKPPTRRRPRR